MNSDDRHVDGLAASNRFRDERPLANAAEPHSHVNRRYVVDEHQSDELPGVALKQFFASERDRRQGRLVAPKLRLKECMNRADPWRNRLRLDHPPSLAVPFNRPGALTMLLFALPVVDKLVEGLRSEVVGHFVPKLLYPRPDPRDV